ncbi:hypothetical protein [Shinella sumterensis]|uniref:hypothetical protein n=1 Tax=Shinella sumterensis TaxID=1967501 RepID=UPI003F85F439
MASNIGKLPVAARHGGVRALLAEDRPQGNGGVPEWGGSAKNAGKRKGPVARPLI